MFSKKPDPAARRLMAQDSDDLAVIAALLQDAAFKLDDMGYDASARRFALTCNRFVWDRKRFFGEQKGFRRRTGLHFDHVTSVQKRDLPEPGQSSETHGILSLLTIQATETEAGVAIDLVFAGGAQIRLAADSLDAYLTDLSDVWEALSRPKHS